MPRIVARVLPALFVLVLLLVALLAPTRRVSASRGGAEVDYLYYPNCTYVTEGGIGTGTSYDILPGEGITQPIGEIGNVATAILPQGLTSNSAGQFSVLFWDPSTLTPAAGQVLLRSRFFDATSLAANYSREDFFPPVITRALPNVAEPPPTQLAIEQRTGSGPYNSPRTVTLVSQDASSLPPALRIQADGTRTPEPGTHPVFSIQLCGGDQALQDMRVVQCVMKGDEELDANAIEYIQRFRIPADATIRWIEFAFGNHCYGATGRVRVFDAAGQDTPPVSFASPILDALISLGYVGVPGAWDSHIDLSSFPTLQANHDYWLVVNPSRCYGFFTKVLHGDESGAFRTYIGPLYRRDLDYMPASLIADRALTFRVIGTPTGTVGVAPLPPRAPLALLATPNPARGAAAIVWTGAVGAVKLEAFDARGRRVAVAEPRGDNGRWALDAGAALPAGVYFVRARDGAGHTARARITLVR